MSTKFSPLKPTNTIKLCKECRYYVPHIFPGRHPVCRLFGEVSVTDGSKKLIPCELARTECMKMCGEDAVYFVQNRPWSFRVPYNDDPFNTFLIIIIGLIIICRIAF